MVRSKYDVPSNCGIKIGARTPSSVPGYDHLRVTTFQGQSSSDVDFLISSDNRSLGRLETFDLDQNPALHIDVHGRPIRGNPNAPVTVINFDDLECPVCAYMHQQLFPAALNRYGYKVRFIYLDSKPRLRFSWPEMALSLTRDPWTAREGLIPALRMLGNAAPRS
jgi:hypothetical protein